VVRTRGGKSDEFARQSLPVAIRSITIRLSADVRIPVKVLVRLLFERRSDRDEYVECRRCGRTLSTDSDRCPDCGPSTVVAYEIP
jgi:uncharacterized OB-fold protein